MKPSSPTQIQQPDANLPDDQGLPALGRDAQREVIWDGPAPADAFQRQRRHRAAGGLHHRGGDECDGGLQQHALGRNLRVRLGKCTAYHPSGENAERGEQPRPASAS